LDARRVDLARERIGLPSDPAKLPTLASLGDAWAERRVDTMRNGVRERTNWRAHVRPALGNMRGPQVNVAWVRSFVESKRKTLSPATVRLLVRLLSQLLQDCAERPRDTGVTANVCFGLPRSIRAMIRPTYDPKTTPYIENARDIEKIAAALDEPFRTAYAIGVLAGLRTGEIRALRWDSVDLDKRQITVREAVSTNGQIGPTKNTETRVLPIAPELLNVLRARKLATGGQGLVVPTRYEGRPSGPKRTPARTMRSGTINAATKAVLTTLGLTKEGLDFYRATRHTYASHFVLGGGSLDHLSRLLGHAGPEVTMRYAHLRPEVLSEADVARIPVDLSSKRGSTRGAAARKNWHGTGRVKRQPKKRTARKHATT